MNNLEQYFIHPTERPVDDSEAKVDLIRSKDHPIISFFYESCFYRHDYEICDTVYALPYEEFFCFVSTEDDYALGATLTIEIAGQTFVTDRCCFVRVPAFVPHGKISLTNMTTPVFSYVTGAGREHTSLPEYMWRPEDVLPMEDMVMYNNSQTTRDPHKCEHQTLIIRSTPGKNTKGETSGSVRRYYKTPGWLYVDNAHLHPTPEILGYFGTDAWHPFELGGSYSQGINGQVFTFDKPTVVFLPPFVPHCPIVVHKLEKENFWHSAGLTTGPDTKTPGFDLKEFNVENDEIKVIDMAEPW